MGIGASKPGFTEKEVGDQSGKVFIVTGSSSGIGKDLAKILYAKNAKVYVAARSAERGEEAIADIKAAHPESKGELRFLGVDLADLTGIKASADDFLRQEERLDVLWNNAGCMMNPPGSVSKQGYEIMLGTNCLGTYLFTKALQPILERTAKSAPAGSVRLVWVSSSAANGLSPKGGVPLDNLDYKSDKSRYTKYGVSKAGNIFHAREYARRYPSSGVVSLALDPGNIDTPLYRHIPSPGRWFLSTFILAPPVYGAYTELFAGLSPEIKPSDNGAWIIPYGKLSTNLRSDVDEASKDPAKGGNGAASKFWDWSERETSSYA